MNTIGILHIFLDMHGVLVEHGTFSGLYRETSARLMHERFGGSKDIWMAAHDHAGEEWIKQLNAAMAQPHGRNYDTIYTALQGEWVQLMFAFARNNGIAAPFLTDAEAYILGNDLGHRIPASFKGVPEHHRDAVRTLKNPPFAGKVRLYVATNAHSQHATGVIQSADLAAYLNGYCTPDILDCFSKNRDFWRRAFQYAGADPQACLVADDEERKGILDPHALGARTVLVNERRPHAGNPAAEHTPDATQQQPARSVADYRIADLSDLPAIVEEIIGKIS